MKRHQTNLSGYEDPLTFEIRSTIGGCSMDGLTALMGTVIGATAGEGGATGGGGGGGNECAVKEAAAIAAIGCEFSSSL